MVWTIGRALLLLAVGLSAAFRPRAGRTGTGRAARKLMGAVERMGKICPFVPRAVSGGSGPR